MRKSIIIFAITLSLTKLSFAELVPEQWCSKCPSGSVLTLGAEGRDRYYCMAPGTNRSQGVPLWAKPSWAKVVGDAQEARCPDTYISFGDEFCYRCPVDYELGTAVTEYRKQNGNSCKRIIGRWEWYGQFLNFYENNSYTSSDGSTGLWQCNNDGSVLALPGKKAKDKAITLILSNDGSSFSMKNPRGGSFHGTKVTSGSR